MWEEIRRALTNTYSCEYWPNENKASSYDKGLSLVAPGTNIWTTTLMGEGNGQSNYTLFNGTSAACPHVSAIVALLLSVDSNLTNQTVKRILERTAQKSIRVQLDTITSIRITIPMEHGMKMLDMVWSMLSLL